MTENTERKVTYWKESETPIIEGDLTSITVSKLRAYNGTKFTAQVICKNPFLGSDGQHPNGYWESLSDEDPRFLQYKAAGADFFYKESLTLELTQDDGSIVLIDLGKKTGYTNKGKTVVKAWDKALAEAAGREPGYYVGFNRMDRRAAEIGADLGGQHLIISTPGFKLKGDPATVLGRLIDEGWYNQPTDEEREHMLSSGIFTRPYRVVASGIGKHGFRGVGTWADFEAAKTTDESVNAEPAAIEQEDIPF